LNSRLPVLVLLATLAGCAQTPSGVEPDTAYRPVPPAAEAPIQGSPGAIYREAGNIDLFMDLRARAIGDILTVQLVERTNAAKESSTNTAKGSSVDTGLPIIAGGPVTFRGDPFLNNELASDSSFGGAADSSQSNRLDGTITVTVADKLPNGNLLVRGEKWITLNQGEEFIQLQGIVRPVDIGPDNSIPSTKVGDARITYSGKGTLADSNKPGWLARFFNGPWFPF
jgi:flagellar L-ring protein FlgH